uniref:strictosidine synthase n=1 Tax=Xylophilus sp. ASV27 TaxID=2795129 RepID=UPI0018ED38CE
ALLCSSGERLLRIGEGRVTPEGSFDTAITCLASGVDGALAIGLDGQGLLLRGGTHHGRRIGPVMDQPLRCPTAALFLDGDTLVVASGSERFAASQWKHDLMAHGRSGSIWRIDLRSGAARRLAHGMAFPYGLALADDGKLLATEAWAHRVVELDAQHPSAPRPVLEDLPAYPARLARATRGGYWLALFAPRNPLIEFVLREPRYRERMVAEVDPRFWIAPTLAARSSFRVPLQAGAIRQMNILKPWAPTFSYGLVAHLDAHLLPTASWHSRADGSVHGVTSLCEHQGQLIAGAKGCGRAVRIDPQAWKD